MNGEGKQRGQTWQQQQQEEQQQRRGDPPYSQALLPGRHIEGRMIKRRRRLEARRQVDKAEITRIMTRRMCF